MPFTRQDNLTDIQRRLAVLATDVHLGNRKNLQNINVFSEAFIAKLLNIIRDSKFVDLNTFSDQNEPGVDLGDIESKISIQVTSKRTPKKIQQTIDQFEEKQLGKYKKMTILLLKIGKMSFRKKFRTNSEHEFDPNKDIFNLDDIYDEITRLPDEKILEVQEFLSIQIRLDPTEPFTQEVYLLRTYFKLLSVEPQEGTTDDDEVADLDLKEEKFKEFWDQLTEIYTQIFDKELEKKFGYVYSTLNQAERENLKKYLRYKSISILLEEEHPIKALNLLKDGLIKDMKMNLISEMQVLNFVYYQLYRCNVFPLKVPA